MFKGSKLFEEGIVVGGVLASHSRFFCLSLIAASRAKENLEELDDIFGTAELKNERILSAALPFESEGV